MVCEQEYIVKKCCGVGREGERMVLSEGSVAWWSARREGGEEKDRQAWRREEGLVGWLRSV